MATREMTVDEAISFLESEIRSMPVGSLRTAMRRVVDSLRIARGERQRGDFEAARRHLAAARHEHERASALASH